MATRKTSTVRSERDRTALAASATTNGMLLRLTFDGENRAAAAARAVSLLIVMRQRALFRPLDHADVQAVIDAFLASARVESYDDAMGLERFRVITNNTTTEGA
jgi:hypothetical protein